MFVVSFALPADASVLTIFKDYTTFRQFFADFVASGEVAPLPGRLPFGNLCTHLSIRYSRLGPLRNPMPSTSPRRYPALREYLFKCRQNSCAALHLPARIRRYPMAMFASRKKVERCRQRHSRVRSSAVRHQNRAAPSPLVLSFRQRARGKIFQFFSRSAKFRIRSTELVACRNPSNVKFNCRR